jgi:hypothetical protein
VLVFYWFTTQTQLIKLYRLSHALAFTMDNNNDSINVRELEKLTKANWFLWRAKVFWNLGVFGEAGEELKTQTRNNNYNVLPNKTQSVREVFTMDNGSVTEFNRPWEYRTIYNTSKEKKSFA